MSHENSAPGQKVPRNFVPEPFAYREVVELEIDDISNLGAGVGRVNGWVVMVPFALGGERVRARIFRNRKNFSEGDLLEVVRRRSAPCSGSAAAANTSISSTARSSNGSAGRSAAS